MSRNAFDRCARELEEAEDYRYMEKLEREEAERERAELLALSHHDLPPPVKKRLNPYAHWIAAVGVIAAISAFIFNIPGLLPVGGMLVLVWIEDAYL